MSAVDFGSNLLNEKQAAQALGVSVRTMQGWRFHGQGPRFVRLSKKAIRYRPSALAEYVARREVSSTSERIGA